MTGFFVLFGLYMATQAGYFAQVCGIFSRIVVPDLATAERLKAALLRRKSAEGISMNLGWIVAVVAFLCAGLTWFTDVVPQVWYAVLCLTISGTFGIVLLRLRTALTKRAAQLAPRRVGAPLWVFILALISAVSLLAFTEDRALMLAAVLVMISCIVTTAIAWRVATMPALLTGEDPDVEAFVDDRLRRTRTLMILIYAVVPQFVFASYSGYTSDALRFGAWLVALAAWLAVSAVFMLALRRSPASDDLIRWKVKTP